MSLPNGVNHHRRRSSSLERRDPYSSPSLYYDEEAVRRQLLGSRVRSVTSVRRRGTNLLPTRADCDTVHQNRTGDHSRSVPGQLSRSKNKPRCVPDDTLALRSQRHSLTVPVQMSTTSSTRSYSLTSIALLRICWIEKMWTETTKLQ